MGRPRGRQHKLRYELQSVRDKSFDNRLRHLARHQSGVCEAETVTVAAACLDFLRASRPLDRGPLDIPLKVPSGRDLRIKAPPSQLDSKLILLSPCAEHDLDLWLEQQQRSMQTARAIRLIEQADRAGCTISLSQLVSLVHQSNRTLLNRLSPLWSRGLRLPVLGISALMQGATCRLAEVLSGHLGEQPPERTRSDLLLSPFAYGQMLRAGTWVIQGYAAGRAPEELAAQLGLSLPEVDSTLKVVRSTERSRKRRAPRSVAEEAGEMVSLHAKARR